MQGGTPSSEFRIPDSELEGSLELHVPMPATFAADARAFGQDPPSAPHALCRSRALCDGCSGVFWPRVSRRP